MGKLVKTLDFITGGALLDDLKKGNKKVAKTPLPEPPKIDDVDIKEEAERKRRALAARKGIGSTVLTSPSGVNESSQVVQRKTLLGMRGDA